MKMTKLLMSALLGAGLSAFAADSDIQRAIGSSYVYRAALAETVTVSVQNGAVTLAGSVPNENFKSLAADVAGWVPGVGRVDNRITVQAPAAEGSDAAIKTAPSMIRHCWRW
jgi:osmotically-inducible protein OsmY